MSSYSNDTPRRDFLRSLALLGWGGIGGSTLVAGCDDAPEASPEAASPIPFSGMQVRDGPNTFRADDFGSGASAVQSAIHAAADRARSVVVVPDSMLPYDASQVRFASTVHMVRENNLTSVVDVRAYGAAGDGTTDDSAAFAAARGAARDTKNAIYVPSTPQSYRHPGTLVLDWAECVIFGDGPNSSKIDFEGAGIGLHVDGALGQSHMLGAYVHDLYLSGDGRETTCTLKINNVDKKGACIRNLSVEDATEENVLMENCWTMEVHNLYAGGHDNGTYGLRAINANNFKFRSVYVLNIAPDGVGIEMTNLDGVHGSGLICEQMDVGLRLVSSATGGIHLNGIYLETSPGHTMRTGIEIGTEPDAPVRNVDISGVHFAIGNQTLVDLNEVNGCTLSGIASNGTGTVRVQSSASNCGIENFDRDGITFAGEGRIRDLEAPSFFISHRAFYGVSGNPAPTVVGTAPETARGYALRADEPADIAAQFRIPDEWRPPGRVEIRLVWTTEDASGSDVSLSASPVFAGEGEDIRRSRFRSTILTDADTAGAINVDTSPKWSASFRHGDVCNLHVRRNASAAQDTLDAPVVILGVEVVKAMA